MEAGEDFSDRHCERAKQLYWKQRTRREVNCEADCGVCGLQQRSHRTSTVVEKPVAAAASPVREALCCAW
jgi:hypothetical protein